MSDFEDRMPTLKNDPKEDDRVPVLSKKENTISTSKGRYAGKKFGGAKGSAKGRHRL